MKTRPKKEIDYKLLAGITTKKDMNSEQELDDIISISSGEYSLDFNIHNIKQEKLSEDESDVPLKKRMKEHKPEPSKDVNNEPGCSHWTDDKTKQLTKKQFKSDDKKNASKKKASADNDSMGKQLAKKTSKKKRQISSSSSSSDDESLDSDEDKKKLKKKITNKANKKPQPIKKKQRSSSSDDDSTDSSSDESNSDSESSNDSNSDVEQSKSKKKSNSSNDSDTTEEEEKKDQKQLKKKRKVKPKKKNSSSTEDNDSDTSNKSEKKDSFFSKLNENPTKTSRNLKLKIPYKLLKLTIKQEVGFNNIKYKTAIGKLQHPQKKNKTLLIQLPRPVANYNKKTIKEMQKRIKKKNFPLYTVKKIVSKKRANQKGHYDHVEYTWS